MQLSIRGARLALAGLLGAAGCAAEAPAEPTWTEDVRPIVIANCIRCHSAPAGGGAPLNFRLDVFDTTITDEGDRIYGAATMAPFMALATSGGLMPPGSPLSARQRETIARWAEASDPPLTFPPRGEPREGNRPPTFSLREPLEDSPGEGRLAVSYEIDDPDLDVVTGEILAGPDRDTAERVTGELHFGRGEAIWDVGVEPEGEQRLFAVIRDGSEAVEVDLGAYEIVHPDGNTAPRASIVAPVADQLLADSDSPFDVVVQVQDPDPGDTLTLLVEAVRPGEVVTIAEVSPAVPGDHTVPLDTAGVEESANWRIRATVSDGTSERTATSRRFVVGHRATELTFEDVEPILVRHCVAPCHLGEIPGVEHNFRFYGHVRDLAGTIYRRVVQQRTMPPESLQVLLPGSVPMSLEERDIFAEWLLAGAPE